MMSVFQKIFGAVDHQGAKSEKSDFDRLMERIDTDEVELATIENRIHEEFDAINGETKNIIQEVDRAVEK